MLCNPAVAEITGACLIDPDDIDLGGGPRLSLVPDPSGGGMGANFQGCDLDGTGNGAISTGTAIPTTLGAAGYTGASPGAHPPSTTGNVCFYQAPAGNYIALVPDNPTLAWDNGFTVPTGGTIPFTLYNCPAATSTADDVATVCTVVAIPGCTNTQLTPPTRTENIPVFGPLGLLAILGSLLWFGRRRE